MDNNLKTVRLLQGDAEALFENGTVKLLDILWIQLSALQLKSQESDGIVVHNNTLRS